MKLTRIQLRKLIESYIVDDKGNVVSATDAYDIALDTAASAIDKSREESGKSPVGQSLVRSSDPESVVQGLEFARALEAEYTDYEKTAVGMSDEDVKPNRPMRKLDSVMKAKYGQGRAMEVYSLVVEDNMGKEVLIPIIDDQSEEAKKRVKGIPASTMFNLLSLYRGIKKQEFIIKQLAPNLDESDYEEVMFDFNEREYDGTIFSHKEKKLYAALEHHNRVKVNFNGYYFDQLLYLDMYKLLSSEPFNISTPIRGNHHQNAKNFKLLRIEPQHKELESALKYASELEPYI